MVRAQQQTDLTDTDALRLGFEGPPPPNGQRRLRRPRPSYPADRAPSTIPVEALVKRPTEAPPPSRDVSVIAEAEVRALDAAADAPRPASRTLRRDESVIAEAVKLRGSRTQRLWDALSGGLERTRAKVATAYRRGTMVRDLAIAFGRLRPPVRAAVVAAPFAVAIVLASVALWTEPAQLPVASAPPAAPPARVLVSSTLEVPRAAPAQAAAPAQTAAPAQAVAAAQAAALPAAAPSAIDTLPAPVAPAPDPRPSAAAGVPLPLTVSEVVRTLPARASLYAAPKKGAPRTVGLAAGAEVLVYPGVPVPPGWVVARKPGGEIGFLRESALEPKAAKEPREAAEPREARSRSRRDDDAPPRASAGEDRPRREAAPKRRERERDRDEDPAPRAPKARRAGNKPLTADDLLLR